MHKGGHAKFILLHVLALSSLAAFLAAATYFHRRQRRRQPTTRDKKVVPRLATTESGHIHRLERFSHYVGVRDYTCGTLGPDPQRSAAIRARQMGFEDANKCPQLCKLAHDYIRKNKGSEDNIYAFLSNNPDADSLYVKLIEEFDKCLLGYFAFHWAHATDMIDQVLNVDSEPTRKLKTMIMAATRKQRFERITKNLKVARVFSTLLVEMKAIGIASKNDSHCTEVMVPAALSERSPVLLLMGGGMGAGKSTVLKDILNESFWVEAGGNAVVVEADAFKETDVIYKALNSRGHHDMLQTAELVHQSSTDAASSLLVTALNEGRDVIMDGTLSWEPFVKQTIAMARNVHHHRYRMGVGYKVTDDGSIIENYWEQVEEELEEGLNNKRRPYRIELVGVVCDAYLAVVRGIRRAILMGRAVRVKSQLRSHKRFASAFPRYCQLVDNARLYCTNGMGTSPELIARKDGDNKMLVNPQEINCLSKVSKLNDNADSIYELYPEVDPACASSAIWNEVVMDPSRADLQHELKIAIQKIESVSS